MNNKRKFKTVEQVIKAANSISRTILFSNDKTKIINAFKIIDCIVKGECVCDSCDSWDSDMSIVFEFGRCLFPTRFFQLVKATYSKKDEWQYIKPLYSNLYNTLYEDILPDTPNIASLQSEADHICKYKLSPQLIKQSIEHIKNAKKTFNPLNKLNNQNRTKKKTI